MTPYWKDRTPSVALDLATSMGGLSANIAEHTSKEIREIRDWCNYLLNRLNEAE